MSNEDVDHHQVHFDLCKRVFERLQREGNLEEVLENFENSQKQQDKEGSVPRGAEEILD